MKLFNVTATFRRALHRRMGRALISIGSLVFLNTPASALDLRADVKLHDRVGNKVGTAKITQERGGNVVIQIRVHDLPAGFHGFHVHAVGECLPPFATAGAHFDLDGHTHKDHTGDLPVLLVSADGTANARFNTDRFEVADLFDANGSALIIHANPDNYANIPSRYFAAPDAPDATTLATGDAGDRIACGVVEKVVERERGREEK